MPTFSNDALICQATGEIDHAEIQRQSRLRAATRYGAACNESDVAYEADKCLGIAQILRIRRRKALGLPDDTGYVTITPYGRQVEGVRFSAF